MSRLEEEELDSKSLMPAESNDRGFKDQIKDDPGPGVVTEAQESEVAAGGQSHHKDEPGTEGIAEEGERAGAGETGDTLAPGGIRMAEGIGGGGRQLSRFGSRQKGGGGERKTPRESTYSQISQILR